jgi:hypothetical protein
VALDTNFHFELLSTLTSALDLGTASAPTQVARQLRWPTGTGAAQADRIFADSRTLSASGTENLDLAGTLTDAYGATITFARIKLVVFIADGGNTNDVQVTRPASNGTALFIAAGDGIALKPGAFFIWADPGATGFAVTAGTGDLLTVTNSAGTTGVTYSVIIIGASA